LLSNGHDFFFNEILKHLLGHVIFLFQEDVLIRFLRSTMSIRSLFLREGLVIINFNLNFTSKLRFEGKEVMYCIQLT
jgi:hypothetical protein